MTGQTMEGHSTLRLLPALLLPCGAAATAANVILCALEMQTVRVRYLSGAKEPRALPPQRTRFALGRTKSCLASPRPRPLLAGSRLISAAFEEKRERLQCPGNFMRAYLTRSPPPFQVCTGHRSRRTGIHSPMMRKVS